MEVTHGRGYVYTIQYHIVWCVKYRYPVLTNEIEKDLINTLNKIAEDNNFQILECNGDKDHIHLLINCSLGICKLLMKKYGELKRNYVEDIS